MYIVSYVIFIVRDDRPCDLLFQCSELTWSAYNRWPADFSIYTPGSNAGQPVSLLRSFTVPAAAVMNDGDAYRERIQATATGILSLLDVDAEPQVHVQHDELAERKHSGDEKGFQRGFNNRDITANRDGCKKIRI